MMHWHFPVNRNSAGRALPALLAAGLTVLAVDHVIALERFDCVIEPSQTVKVGSPVTGILEAVAVGRGDRVSKGQVIARLDARVEKATVELQRLRAADQASIDAQAVRLEHAERRVVRLGELLKQKAMTTVAHEEAEADLAVNRAEVERLRMQQQFAVKELARAEAALSLRTIRSPLDGIVSERAMSPGEFVNQDGHILTIADIDPLHVEVFLPVPYFRDLKLGATGEVRPAEPIGGTFPATVTVIDQVFDATSNTFGVLLSLNNPNENLPAGQRCTVGFDVKSSEPQSSEP